ncbi:MAG: molybdate ABC transporter substrate-binding protein [Clostridiales Family XIII bacterium]|jgi:molybdate transport system substrate-binding protein|nr:molybdate ABC transporter substrate-binding protein [Clostridiales Family XIII bacterium]
MNMRKMGNKWVLLLAMVTIVAMMMVGCASGKTADKKEEPVEKEPAPAPVELTIGAAASLTGALNEIIEEYKVEAENVTVTPVYEGSGVIQKQIEEGAPMDLFISAAKSNMDTLADEDLILADTREDLLTNSLVLIGSAEKADSLTLDTLAEASNIALGEIDTVPAGKYAKQSLESLGLWADIESKIVYQKDVKAVLQAVETGNADAGFVYKSDATSMTSAKEIAEVPADSHDPIVYPAALVKATKEKQATEDFLAYLKEDDAKTIFEKYGFSVK